MKKKVLIGITTSKRAVDVNFLQKQDITYISNSIIELFQSHDNVIPIILSPDTHPHLIEEVCTILDGLLLSSGEDVDPSFYKSAPMIKYDEKISGTGQPFHRPKMLEPNPKRDKFEIDLYHEAKKKNIPILGICRGMQLINVAEGGTLHQENPQSNISHFIEKDGWIHYHNIKIEKESKLFSLLKTDNSSVSSIHHQSICQLASTLKASAKADDGTIEIIEHAHKDFILGIQGHIEKMANYPIYKKLIDAFIQNASRSAIL
jgi:putative glutamine amidotransferase